MYFSNHRSSSYYTPNMAQAYVPPPSKNKKKNKRTKLFFKRKNRRKRAVLLKSDSFCFYCTKRLDLDTSTLDHCIPLSKGGSSKFSNLVLACHECNQSKGNKIYIKRC